MISHHEAKRSHNQDNTMNRNSLFRRPNAIIVAASSDDEDDADNRDGEQQRESHRCCG